MDALDRAGEIVRQMLDITRSLSLTGTEEFEEAEIEAYINLLDEREIMIEELSDLKNQLTADEISSPAFEKIKADVTEIAKASETHIKTVKLLHKKMQSSYKDIKQGQRIHAGYSPLPSGEVSSTFDVMH